MSDNPGAGSDGREKFGAREPNGVKLGSLVSRGRRSLWFKAEQVRLRRPTAVKYLADNLAASAAVTEAFFEAGRQAAVIVHPSAIPIFNVYRSERCIAMYWCGGKPLKELSGCLPPAAVASVGIAVMDCLAGLHATGRRHGNISPGNIFLDEEGAVWINDFFQPPILADGDLRFSGEPRYIAPELLAGGEGDWSADVFSLGRVLADCLDPDSGSPILDRLFAAMQADDPANRPVTPEGVKDAFIRVRREEEARIGIASSQAKRGERRYRRVPGEFDVSLRKRSATPVETASILMKTRDIGESGVFVETDDESLSVGSILELDFTLKGVDGNVHAFGIVRWVAKPPLPPGVGVQFVEVDLESLSRLRNYLGNK